MKTHELLTRLKQLLMEVKAERFTTYYIHTDVDKHNYGFISIKGFYYKHSALLAPEILAGYAPIFIPFSNPYIQRQNETSIKSNIANWRNKIEAALDFINKSTAYKIYLLDYIKTIDKSLNIMPLSSFYNTKIKSALQLKTTNSLTIKKKNNMGHTKQSNSNLIREKDKLISTQNNLIFNFYEKATKQTDHPTYCYCSTNESVRI